LGEAVKIGYLSIKDALDADTWSGTIYKMYAALRDEAGEVEVIGPRPRPLWLRLFWHYLNAIRRIFGQRLGIMQSVPLSWACGYYYGSRLKKSDCDIVFAPIAAMELAYLKTDKPIVYLSDTNFMAQVGYYFPANAISALGKWEGNYLEKRAVDRSARLVYSNQWAADGVVELHDADPAKVRVIPFGANLQREPAREALRMKGHDGPCRLLFVSRDWVRKGGAIAVAALRALEGLGVEAELTVVGCEPEETDPRMVVIASLNKRVPEQEAQLFDLYRNADFFLIPTRAECSAIVMCEAGAFGLPTISTDTGGISTIVVEGENGFLLPLQAEGDEYAAVIARVWSDQEGYARLRASTRKRYEEELNWKVWGARMGALMEEVVAGARGDRVGGK
jgi:glycosyltransferase involved in cell wall biosynthesis